MDEVFLKAAEMDGPMLLLSLQSFVECFRRHELTVSIRFDANLFFFVIRVEGGKGKRRKTSMLVCWNFSFLFFSEQKILYCLAVSVYIVSNGSQNKLQYSKVLFINRIQAG